MRKNLGLLTAVCGSVMGFVASSASVQAVELLTNPTLDATSISSQVAATPTGWTVTSTKAVSGAFNDGASSEPWCNVAAAGGMGLFFKPFQGVVADKVTTSLQQDNLGAVGQWYTMTGWAGCEPNYIANSDLTAKSEFHIDFLTGASTLISSATLDLKTAGMNGSSTNFGYAQYSLSALAPAGTVIVRTRVSMVNAYGNPAGGGQAFVVDALSLSVPEPTTLGLASLATVALAARRRK